MPAQTVSFGQAVAGPLATLYGNAVSGLTLPEEEARAANLAGTAGTPRFAQIRAWRVGTFRCVTLPTPIILVVFGEGQELTEPECGFTPGDVLKWSVPFGTRVLALEPSRGTVEELLETLSTKGIDGGISFENPRYENGRLCVDIRIWAKISVLGANVKFDERFPICINVGQPCFTIWEIGRANLRICYRAPNQICARLCVGKWGIERCWEECVAIPLPAVADDASPSDCREK